MFKVSKSILIVCLVSLFLLVSQASAADSNGLSISDINSVDENYNLDASYLDSLQDSNGMHSDSSLNSNGLDDKSNYDKTSISQNQTSSNLKDNDLDNNDGESEIIEEEAKDTEGVVMAGDSYSCGPASLATALNRLGLNLSLSEVSQHTNTSKDGTNMQSLIDAAGYYNFSAVGVEIQSKDLAENSIVHLDIDGAEHWTVVSKVTEESVFLADSTRGNINMSIDEFNSLFSGKAILLSELNKTNVSNVISNKNIKVLDQSQCLNVKGKGWVRVLVGYKTEWRYGLINTYSWVLRPKVINGHVSYSAWEYVKVKHLSWGKYKVKVPIYKYKYIKNQYEVKGKK